MEEKREKRVTRADLEVRELRGDVDALRAQLGSLQAKSDAQAQELAAQGRELVSVRETCRRLDHETAELRETYSSLNRIVGKLKRESDERDREAAALKTLSETAIRLAGEVEAGGLSEADAVAQLVGQMPEELRAFVETALAAEGVGLDGKPLDVHATGGVAYKRPGAWAKHPAAEPDTMHLDAAISPPGAFGRGRRTR